MKLDLTEILGNVGMRYVYPVDEPPIVDEDLECTDRIRGEFVFTNTGSVLLIDGSAQTRAVVPCSRCLVYYEEPLSITVSEQFPMEPRAVGPRGQRTNVVVEEDENPDAGRLFEGPLFDLTELLRQDLMLALPTQPLHDEACKGLCPSCGSNLNEGSCGCAPQPAHPALAQLSALLDDTRKN